MAREIGGARRSISALSLCAHGCARYTLEDIDYHRGRRVRAGEGDRRPARSSRRLTHNFCEGCNACASPAPHPVHVLGKKSADLRTPLRAAAADEPLQAAIDEAIAQPKGHDFVIDRRTRQPALAAHEHHRRLIDYLVGFICEYWRVDQPMPVTTMNNPTPTSARRKNRRASAACYGPVSRPRH